MILIVMTYLAGLGALFFVADIKLWSGIAAVSAAILAIVLLLGKEKKLAAVILFGSCFMEGIWIIVKIYPLYLAGIYVMMLSLGVLFTGSIQERKRAGEESGKERRIKGSRQRSRDYSRDSRCTVDFVFVGYGGNVCSHDQVHAEKHDEWCRQQF